jgi:hypothetical protein
VQGDFHQDPKSGFGMFARHLGYDALGLAHLALFPARSRSPAAVVSHFD